MSNEENRENQIHRLIELGIESVEREEDGVRVIAFIDDLYLEKFVNLLEEQEHVTSK